jgi:tRNA A-37 threonylcarbamoyl transferase component Bud32
VPPFDANAIRRRYGLTEAIRLRVSGRAIVAWVEGAGEAAEAVAESAESLPVAPRTGRAALRSVGSSLGPLLVREYRKGGLFRGMRGRRFLGRMRPLDELALTRRLLSVRVPVVEAVAAVVHPSPFGWRGFLLSREVAGSLDLETFLYDPAAHTEWPVIDALTEAGRAVRSLHDASVRHGDLHLKNLLLDPSTASVRVLDLDRSRAADGPLSEDDRLHDLVRLARSVEKHRLRGLSLGRKGALRFLRAYGGDAEAGDRWLDAVRTRLRRWLGLRMLWWRLSGQARPRRRSHPSRPSGDHREGPPPGEARRKAGAPA